MSATAVRRQSIRLRVLGVLGLVVVLSVGTMAVVSYQLGSATLEQQALDQLTAVRELQARQVETYFRIIVDQAVTSSENRMFVDALGEFTQAVSTLTRELRARGTSDDEAELGLRLYYQDEFMPRLASNVDGVEPLDDYWPTDAVARSLQHLFISSNPFDVGSKHLLDASDEGTGYDAVHERYHPLFRSFLERFGYYDIFLVDAASHRIVYSVFKEVDFGTSLERGPHRGSNLAAAYRGAASSRAASSTSLEDFRPYAPSYGAPASFIASPIMDGDDVVGALVFQLPLDRINGVMTSERAWREVGLGETGESYIVGSDFRLRTESRFLVEDFEGYLNAVRGAGVPEATLRSIESQGTAVGLQPVRTEGTERALAGESGVARFDDYRGVPVLSSFRPLDIPGLNWALMSEIDESEALGPLTAQRNRMLVVLTVLLPLLGLLAAWFAGNLTRPIQALSATANRLAEGQLDVAVDVGRDDEIGDLAKSFESMRVSLRDLIDRQNRSIEALSTPLIPIQDGVVVLPIVGELDQTRCDRLRASLTEQLHANGARFAILDLTGVPDLDEDVARGLVRIARSARLLGARAIISGVQPGLALRMADGDVGIEGVMTARTLREAIETAVEKEG
jgi:anti-anti-sigma regulatory factor/HAMP domain-containing protein